VLGCYDIRYRRVLQKLGRLVLTAPSLYNQGWNGGCNAAKAINLGDG
jgi:hypothetical protein